MTRSIMKPVSALAFLAALAILVPSVGAAPGPSLVKSWTPALIPVEIPNSASVALAIASPTEAWRFSGTMLQKTNPSVQPLVWTNVWNFPNAALVMQPLANGDLLIGAQKHPTTHETPLYLLPAGQTEPIKVLVPRPTTSWMGNWPRVAYNPTTNEVVFGEGATAKYPPGTEPGPRVWTSSDGGYTWAISKQFDPVHHDTGSGICGYRHLHDLWFDGDTLYAATGDIGPKAYCPQNYRHLWRRVNGAWELYSDVEGFTAGVTGPNGRLYMGSDVPPYGIYEGDPQRPEWGLRLLLNLDNTILESYIAEMWFNEHDVLYALTNGPQHPFQVNPISVIASADGGWTWHVILKDTKVEVGRYGMNWTQTVPVPYNGIPSWWAKIGMGTNDLWAIPDLTPEDLASYPIMPPGR